MRYNQHIRIIGEKVMLVPYKKYHVAKYHKWMLSEELQKLTASEPLTLEEEYEMQKSWHEDDDKCTFIVLDKKRFQECNNQVESMVGDTNLFFSNGESRITAEAEIMIAESQVRGNGLGKEAIVLMLLFGINHLGVKHYVAKISWENSISVKLFEKLGFIRTSSSAIFKEITFERLVSEDWMSWLKQNVGEFEIDENYLEEEEEEHLFNN